MPKLLTYAQIKEAEGIYRSHKNHIHRLLVIKDVYGGGTTVLYYDGGITLQTACGESWKYVKFIKTTEQLIVGFK